jgi:ferredoxin--NADP+ reductase
MKGMTMAAWLDARIIERIDWNSHLFSLRFTCPDFPGFTAGQFVKIGLPTSEGQILSRPYSLVNSPTEDYFEIMAVPVTDGSLSPKLHILKKGDDLKLMSPATGFLTIEEVPQSERLFMLATGTGVGPFLSIIQSQDVWDKFKHIVLVYAARKAEDLAYLEDIEALVKQRPSQLKFVPITSREVFPNGLYGRIPSLLQSMDIQKHCGLQIEPENSQVMLCGNPEMIKDAIEALSAFGLKKHLRRSPGQISMERYW